MSRLLFISYLCMCVLLACKDNDCKAISTLPAVPGCNITKIPAPYQQSGKIVDFWFVGSQGYFSTTGGDIYKTWDSGVHWETLELPVIENRAPTALFFDGSYGYVCMDSVTTGPFSLPFIKVIITHDGGETWTVYQLNVRGKMKQLIFTSPTRGVALIQKPNVDFAIYYTEDGGFTWIENQTVRLGNIQPRWSYLYTDPLKIYASDVFNKVWKSDDGGVNWSPLFQLENTEIYQIYAADENLIYYTEDKGLFLYKHPGQSEQLSENKTHILLFNRKYNGVTFQKPADCNEGFLNNMNFSSGNRAVFVKKTSTADWIQSDNSKLLDGWTCKPTYEDYSYGVFDSKLYLIELAD